jgi:cobalamin biosynthesis protein CobT
MKQLEYQILMAEEGITLDVLPREIKDKIKMLKPTVGRYNNTPTDKLKDAITKQDVEIAEMIADYIESDEYKDAHGNNDDNNDDDDSDDNNGNNGNGVNSNDDSKASEEAAKKVAEAEAAKRAEEATAKKPKYAFGTDDMEKAIMDECNVNNGFIKEDKLVSIIKRTPNYPVQEVYTISLRKVFMKDIYKLQ